LYRLVVSTEGHEGEHAFDLERDVVLVGRRAGADVPLPHPDVGGVHLRLERAGREVTLVDGAIASGTVVNGVRLGPGARRALADGDAIVVAGRFRLRFAAVSPAGAATAADATAALARAMVRDVLASLSESAPEATPWLEDASSGTRVALPAPGRSLVLGRGETCDVVLRDSDLSRDHARLTRAFAGTTLADLGSKNGTRVNDERLDVGVERPLHDGDRVSLGATTLVFRDPTDAYLRELAAAVAPAPAAPADPPAPPAPGPFADPLPPPAPRPSRLPFLLALVVILGALGALVFLLLHS